MFPLLESIKRHRRSKFVPDFIFKGVLHPIDEFNSLNEGGNSDPYQDSDKIHRDHSSSVNKYVRDYTSAHHYDINKALLKIHKMHSDLESGGDKEYFDERRKHHRIENQDTYNTIEHLTSHINSQSKIRYPFYVYTAVKFDVAKDFLQNGNGVILKYHHPAFTSTSTRFDETPMFAKNFIYTTGMVEDSPFTKLQCKGDVDALLAVEENTKSGVNTLGISISHILRIKIPNHGKAISVKMSSEHHDEDEILIQRNLDINIHGHPEVILVHGHSRKFYFIWDAEYVGHTMMDV